MNTADNAPPSLTNLPGLWTRSLIAWPDGRCDVTTAVHWLQGPSLYIDLRQPAARPDFSATRALADVTDEQLAWLVRQEGFAGRLRHEDGCFEWGREIDFQPQAIYSDCGQLRFEADYMVEVGRDIPYIEHWHRSAIGDVTRCVALRLRDATDGRAVSLVRTGNAFMLAADRGIGLPNLPDLAACVAAASDRDAQLALVDCELSFGSVGAHAWRIERSSLPWREGLAFKVRCDGQRLRFVDACTRRYDVIEAEGVLSLLSP
jgi:hypothetical protein